MDGVLVVDKPAGPTSHDVVAVARRGLRTPRVGHTGTLDPMATGVLTLVVGRATRLAQYMTGATKDYDATIVFGRSTDTYDAQGATTAQTGRHPEAEAILAALAAQVGTVSQTPPVYSAKKIGGEASYRRARRAAPVVPAPVDVVLHDAVVEHIEGATVRVRLRVSAGFYVRSLAHDLGACLGTGAHLGALRRTRSGPFDLSGAVSWEQVASGGTALTAALVPLDRLLPEMRWARLPADAVARVRHGQSVHAAIEPGEGLQGGPIRLTDPEGRLVGIGTAVAPAVAGGAEELREADRRVMLQPVVVLG